MARKKALEENILTDSTYYILITLVTPRHGYSIMQEVKEKSDGEVEIGPASLYTSLKKLQEAELITLLEIEDERRKTYTLSEKESRMLREDIERRIIMVEQGKKALKLFGEIRNG